MRSPSQRRPARPEAATRATSFAPAERAMFTALLAASVLIAAGCLDASTSSPAQANLPTTKTNPTPATPSSPPVIVAPSALYRRITPGTFGLDAYHLSLAPDSAFVIEFSDGTTSWGWAGRYEHVDSMLIFHYNAWSAAGALDGRGALHGDTLLLRYNVLMQMTDFQDGVYVRDPSVP